MKEKLQEYALIAEIVGGVAIVASLIFVGVQIQQNTVATQGNTRNQLIDADLTVLLSPDAAKVAVNMRRPDELAEEEAAEVVIYLTALLYTDRRIPLLAARIAAALNVSTRP